MRRDGDGDGDDDDDLDDDLDLGRWSAWRRRTMAEREARLAVTKAGLDWKRSMSTCYVLFLSQDCLLVSIKTCKSVSDFSTRSNTLRIQEQEIQGEVMIYYSPAQHEAA